MLELMWVAVKKCTKRELVLWRYLKLADRYRGQLWIYLESFQGQNAKISKFHPLRTTPHSGQGVSHRRGRVAQSVGHMTRKSGVLGSIPGLATVSYWRRYVHEVLVNRLGGQSLPRKSVVRLTDRPDMTLDVYRGRKITIQQQQGVSHSKYWSIQCRKNFSKLSSYLSFIYLEKYTLIVR